MRIISETFNFRGYKVTQVSYYDEKDMILDYKYKCEGRTFNTLIELIEFTAPPEAGWNGNLQD